MLSQRCLKIKECQDSGKDLTDAQEAFVMEADLSLDDWWYTLLHNNKRQLGKYFDEPFLSELRAAVVVIRRAWKALDKIAQGV